MQTDHWVYVIAKVTSDGFVGPVKIGITSNLAARLSAIQTSCPFKIEFAYVFECPNRNAARAVELAFHDVKKESRLHGEWFEVEPVRAIHMLCIAIRALMLKEMGDDPDLIDRALRCCGVLSAERRWGLLLPKAADVRH